MRTIILIVVFAMFSSLVFAQNEDVSIESGMKNVSEPTFKGTENTIGINEFIQENLRTPLNSQNRGIEGAVVVQFNVSPTGNLSEVGRAEGSGLLLRLEAPAPTAGSPRAAAQRRIRATSQLIT